MKFPRSGLAALIAVCALALPGVAQASITQFRISNFGPDADLTQRASLPDIAFNSQNGQFLAVYQAGFASDDNHWVVWGQRLDANGGRIGDPFPISGPTGDYLCAYDPPAVAYSPQANEFLVTWNQGPSGGCDGYILAQRIAADGSLLAPFSKKISGDGFDDTETTQPVWNPNANEWLVAWKANVPGTSKQELFSQRLAGADLSEVGTDDQRLTRFTDTANSNANDAVAVAFDPVDNRYLVVTRARVSTVAGNNYEAFGHLMSADGTQIGDNYFRISHTKDTNPNGNATPPNVMYDPVGNRFLVGWSADPMLGSMVDNEMEVIGRMVNPDGSLVGSADQRISDMGPDGSTSFLPARPDMAYNTNAKEYFLSWHSDDDTAPMVNNEQEVFGQRLDASGAEVGDNDFRISHDGPDGDTQFTANRPAVAFNSNTCQFMIAWASGDVSGNFNTNEEWDIYGNLVDAPCPPVNQTLPVVSGTAQEGQGLACSDGTWSGRGLAFSREWLRNGQPIGGATSANYVSAGADVGKQIACRVTATSSDGSANAISAAVVPTAKPDTTPPICTVSIKKQKLKNVLEKGLKLTASCNEAAALNGSLTATFNVSKRSARAAKVLTVSKKSATLKAPGRITFTLKLTKKAKRALAKVKKVKFTAKVTAKDAAGNASKAVKKSLTLKR